MLSQQIQELKVQIIEMTKINSPSNQVNTQMEQQSYQITSKLMEQLKEKDSQLFHKNEDYEKLLKKQIKI